MNAFLSQFLSFARRNPIMVASISIIVIMGSASWFLWQRQQDLTGQHDEIRRSGEDILTSLTSQARINTELATVAEALDFIDRNLINEADLAENLGYFYQIETASRIRFSQLNQLSSQPQPPGSHYKPVPFALRATGTYRQIIRLLHELESGPRLLRIRTYTLNQTEGEADLVNLEMTVEVLGRP
jgi:Tfp pilus assembly protein PilO